MSGINTRSLAGCTSVAILSLCMTGCASTPKSFVASAPGWKTIELNEVLQGNYDLAWQKTVDTVARDWDIELLDKDSGYIRTSWKYDISGQRGRRRQTYRGRITLKFPEIKNPNKLELRTGAQWLRNRNSRYWESGFDTNLERDVYAALAGRLGRTVPRE